jgi:hypothetical protein
MVRQFVAHDTCMHDHYIYMRHVSANEVEHESESNQSKVKGQGIIRLVNLKSQQLLAFSSLES